MGQAVPALRIGERVVAVPALKPGIAWVFSPLHSTEEALKRPVQTEQHILKYLTMDSLILLSDLGFDLW